jgi:hypothetical protein
MNILKAFAVLALGSHVSAQLTHQQNANAQKATLSTLYSNVNYPIAQGIIASGQIPAYFASNVRGRITPVNKFEGPVNTEEYFYGLSPVPNQVSPYIIASGELTSFASSGDVAATQYIFRFQNINNASDFRNLIQTGFWRFNSVGQIEQYDLALLNLYEWLASQGADYRQFAFQVQTILGVCTVHSQFCLGANKQYNSTLQCIAFLWSIPFGTPDNYYTNTVACRTIHVLLIPFRPEVHCPHIGPTGGGKCIDQPYQQKWFSGFFAPGTFQDTEL